jgi:hypothetical protein
MLKVRNVDIGIENVKATMRITHPKANLITVQIGHDAQCNFPMSVELALSSGYAFLDYAVPEFAEYGELISDDAMMYYNMRSQDHDPMVMVYRNVPLTALAKFLHLYGEKV